MNVLRLHIKNTCKCTQLVVKENKQAWVLGQFSSNRVRKNQAAAVVF